MYNIDERLVLGTCYYPEHWDSCRWSTDLQMMKDAGISVLRIMDLAWAIMESEDGKFDFSLFDNFLDLADSYGFEYIFCTPTEASPVWLREKHPDAVSTGRDGLALGARGYHCHNSEFFRFYSERIVSEMSKHFKNRKNVIGWQLDNEIKGVDCYCGTCEKKFRDWLKQRYKTIDRLNTEWGTVFWSQIYHSFDEIKLPKRSELTISTSQTMDYKRFISDTTVDYISMQAKIIRKECPEHLLTHNTMSFYYHPINKYDLSKPLDFISWDNYPHVDGNLNDVSAMHDLMRSCKHKNFWVMEQKNGYFNGSEYNLAIVPGLVRSWTYHDISRGANGVLFYRWRANRWGQEQNPNGLLRHDGTPRRAYEEVLQTNRELKKLEEKGCFISNTQVEAKVAIIHSYDNIWSFEAKKQYRYYDCIALEMEYYNSLTEMGITVDFISPEDDFSGYKLIIAPYLMCVSEKQASNFKHYAENGGRIIFGPRSGMKSINNAVVDIPWPGLLRNICGITVEEFEAFPPDSGNFVIWNGRKYPVKIWADIMSLNGSKSVAVYSEKFYKNTPAVTKNKIGKGVVYYCGIAGCKEFLYEFLSSLCTEIGLETAELPHNVFLSYRSNASVRFAFLINLSLKEEEVNIPFTAEDLLTGEVLPNQFIMKPQEVRIFKL